MVRRTVYQYRKTTMTPSSEKSKLPRLKRVATDKVPAFQLTARDVEILQAVYSYRALSTPQIDGLFFSAPGELNTQGRVSSRCLHRLKLLFHAGYLRRVEQAQTLSDGRKPLVYFLDRRGAQTIADLEGCRVGDLDWDRQGHEVGALFLDHLLLSNEVQVAVTLAARDEGYILQEWRDERSLRRAHYNQVITLLGEDGKQQGVTLIPDGYFLLETEGARYHQFLEIDRATSTLQVSQAGKRDWARKVATYLEYYRSGAYQERYKTQNMRILTVTTSQKRLAHLKRVTDEAGGKSRFWFTTMEKISRATVLKAPIWHMAGREGLYSFVW
jgi:hypothetical protein